MNSADNRKENALSMPAILNRAGFSLEDGTLSDRAGNPAPDTRLGPKAAPDTRKVLNVPNARKSLISLTPDDIRDSGGLPQAISRKAAAVIRESFQGLDIRQFPPDTLDEWEYILSHFRPHMDEYLSSLFLRACLPDDMRRLRLGETFLTSRDDDPQAKALWPHAAVLGIGGTVNGVQGGIAPSWYNLQYFFYTPLMFAFFLVFIWSTAPMAAFSRDFENMIISIMSGVFWLSGIVYDTYSLEGPLRRIMLLNPITFFANGYRNTFLYHRWFWEYPTEFIIMIVEFAALIALGIFNYNRLRKRLPDVL